MGKQSLKSSNPAGISLKQTIQVAFASSFAFVTWKIYSTHVYTQDYSKYEIGRWRTNTSFIRHEIPITYYKRGQLSKVLPKSGWLSDGGDEGMRVFRLEPGETMEFDSTKVVAPLRMNSVEKDCSNIHGLCPCPGEFCIQYKKVYRGDTQSVLNGTTRDVYANFAYLEEEAVDYLESLLGWPTKLDRSFENCFISNFEKRIVSAPIHANPFSHSLAVQFVGSKTWIFFRARDYLSDSGFGSVSVSPATFPSRAPKRETMDYWAFKSQPGDLLYFPTGYGHVVSTDPGPSVLVTFRKPYLKQLLQYPVTTLAMALNVMFFSTPSPVVEASPGGETLDAADKSSTLSWSKIKSNLKPKPRNPESAIQYYRMHQICPKICEDSSPYNIDRILAQLLMDYAIMVDPIQ
jgi:hypothetical protein